MKIACSPSSFSPHEDTTMNRKPSLSGGGGGANGNNDEEQLGFVSYHGSPGRPDASYYGRQQAPEHMSPSESSWGNQYMNMNMNNVAEQQPPLSLQVQPYGSPFYPAQQSALYSNQMPPHAHAQVHGVQQPRGYYYQGAPNPTNWHPTPPPPAPPMMPSMGGPQQAYYAHHQHQLQLQHQQQQQHQHSPHNQHNQPPSAPMPMMMYQTLDSRGSLSSYGSSDTMGSSRHSHTHTQPHAHRSRGRGSRSRRNSNQGRNSGGPGGGGGGNNNNGNNGSPPNRGWYRYDDTTTLYQMKGRIVEIAKDRDGSKFIQRRLQLSDRDEMQVACDEALEGVEELWNDVYGNYILQGLLELGTEGMRDGIGRKIVEGDVVSLSTKIYGCRLIQKALDTLTKADVANIVSSVKGKVWLLVHDHNGNHVIQKSVTKINEFFHQEKAMKQAAQSSVHPPASSSPNEEEEVVEVVDDEEWDAMHTMLVESLDIIVDEVTSSIKDLTIHPYGCRVVQRLIEHSVDPHKTKVLDCIVSEGLFSTLINHEYGNYVVQRVIAYGRASDKEAIFETITGNILKLSKMKHSSNVVEMMLTYGDAGQRQHIIEEILNCHCVDQKFVTKPAAVAMAEDSYGNYVIKTSLDVLQDGAQRERLFNLLLSNLEDLEKSPFAKQVVLRVKTYAQDSTYE